MLLAIDVGNTNTVIGLYAGDRLAGSWRMSTSRSRTSDETGMFLLSLLGHANIAPEQVSCVILCSVVPPVMHSLTNAILRYFRQEPMVVGPGIRTGINIRYENPREVGADKIVNAVGALKKYGGPVIIVDFGTATTLCAVNEKRDYLGGIICPGIQVSAEALFEKASKLPRIEIQKPSRVIGKTTVASMQSGIVHGFVGQVDHLVQLMKREMGLESVFTVATGGMARLIATESATINEVDPMLTLDGLREIYRQNTADATGT